MTGITVEVKGCQLEAVLLEREEYRDD